MTENDSTQTSDVEQYSCELKRLDPLLGTWKTKDHTKDSVLGPSVPVESTESYYWLEGGYFLVSTWVTIFGDAAPQKGNMFWGYDVATQKFRTHFFDNQGPYDEAGSRYEGVVAYGKLTFTGPARFQYDLDDDGKIKVNPDGTITVVWWLRDNDGNWQHWMNNTFSRIKEGG